MKKVKVSTSIERQLLIGMIMSDNFLKTILPIFDINYIDIPAGKTISKWIVNYYKKFKKAPKAVIQDIYNEKIKKVRKEEKEWLADFLESISKEYEKAGFNEEFLFERTCKYFKGQKLKKNISKIEDLLDNDEIDEAEKLWVESRKIPHTFDLGFNPFDIKTAKELMRREENRVILYTGIKSLDKIAGPSKSGWLVVFMGPQKRGKTWTLMCLALAACLQGLNVSFISLESEDEDLALRFWMMVGSLVSKLSAGEETKSIALDFPYYSKSGEIKKKKYRTKVANIKSVKKIIERFNILSSGKLMMKRFPMMSAGPLEIETHLDSLEAFTDFSPHVIIVDYLGIMKDAGKDRETYNKNSAFLKGLAQERKAVVITGHQGRRETLSSFNINSDDMPEDIRILGHLDVLFGLNQTAEEREDGIMRISNLIHRHRKYRTSKQVQLLQQLEAGQFNLDNKLVRNQEIEDEIMRRE